MTNVELSQQLNQELSLLGKQAVTANVVRQWVRWKLLKRATILGKTADGKPVWERDEQALEQAKRLATYRCYGLVREDQLICRCYIDGWDIDVDRLRLTLRKRLQALHAVALKRFTSTIERERRDSLSVAQKRAIRNQIGRLDRRFIGTAFELTPDNYVDIFREAIADSGRLEVITEPFQNASEALFPEMKMQEFPHLSFVVRSIAGLFANPDQFTETPFNSVETCENADFALARSLISRLFEIPDFIERFENHMPFPPELIGQMPIISNTIRTIEKSEWPTWLFLTIVHGLRKSGNANPQKIAKLQAFNDDLARLSSTDLLISSNAFGPQRL